MHPKSKGKDAGGQLEHAEHTGLPLCFAPCVLASVFCRQFLKHLTLKHFALVSLILQEVNGFTRTVAVDGVVPAET